MATTIIPDTDLSILPPQDSRPDLKFAINNAVDALISQSPALNVYTTLDNSTPAYVRNLNCWVPFDTTCWPVAVNTSAAATGCAVTPRHLIVARHVWPAIGATIRFVTLGNAIVERTVTHRAQLQDYVFQHQDLAIVRLNMDLPQTITPAKVLPETFENQIPLIRYGPTLNYNIVGGIPIIAGRARNGPVLVLRDWLAHYDDTPLSDKRDWHEQSTASSRQSVTQPIEKGDSGSPVFALIGGEMVLLGTHAHSQAFPSVCKYLDVIATQISSWGDLHTLQTVDLSGYKDYTQ